MIRHTTQHATRHAPAASAIRVVAVAAVLCVAAAAFTPKLRAGSGKLVVLPSNVRNVAHGLRISIDTRWGGGYGYRPVRFLIETFPAGSKAKRDRVLLVELAPRNIHRDEETTVTQFLELPEGASSAEVTMLAPVEDNWDRLLLNVYEDGQQLAEFSDLNLIWSNLGTTIEPERITVGSLFVSGEAPRLRERGNATPQRRNSQTLPFRASIAQVLSGSRRRAAENDQQVLDYYHSCPDAELVHPKDLPENWLGLTELDVIHIPLADLRAMKENHPQRLDAVLRWLATGTTLWISDEWGQAASLPEIENILGMSAVEDAASRQGDELAAFSNLSVSILDHDAWHPDKDSGCVIRRFGLGRVTVGDPQLSRGKQANLVGGLAAVDPPIYWPIRHGVVPRRPHARFENWLIPGAGEPPVTAFRLLITLFVLAIGPLNIWLVRRLRRTYLIMITIPLAAVLVTTVLLAYAAVRDGFGVQARVLSYTMIDQQAGLTVSVSRQSYFASIVPAEGMVYPADVAVYPLESYNQGQWSDARRIDWRGEGQRLTEGYLPSRQTAQFMVFTSHRETTARLDVKPPGEASDALQVTNKLGSRIKQLMVVDAGGGVYWAEDVAPDAVTDLEVATIPRVTRELCRAADENTPQEGGRSRTAHFITEPPYSWTDVVGSSESLLKQSLDTCRTPIATPNTYLAIVEKSPAAPLGASAEENGSFHVIAGRW